MLQGSEVGVNASTRNSTTAAFQYPRSQFVSSHLLPRALMTLRVPQ